MPVLMIGANIRGVPDNIADPLNARCESTDAQCVVSELFRSKGTAQSYWKSGGCKKYATSPR